MLTLAIVIYIFFATSPIGIDKRKTNKYNFIVCIIGVIGCIVASMYSYFTTGKSVDSAWWPVAAFFLSIIVFTVTIIAGGFYRNFVHFSKQNGK